MVDATRSRDRSSRRVSPLPDRGLDVVGLRGEGTTARRAWQSGYVRRIVAGDFLCAVIGAGIGYLVRFSSEWLPPIPLVWLAGLLPLVWSVAMLVGRTYEKRFLWIGPEEYHRVFVAAVMVAACVGTVSWAFQLEIARGFIVVALPVATLLTLLQRHAQRNWLNRQRSRGRFGQTTLIVGHQSGIEALLRELVRIPHHGYRPVGCCLPRRTLDYQPSFAGLPVLGTIDDVVHVVEKFEVDTVAVLPCPELDGPTLRRLGWHLETTRADLLLAPAVTEIAGPRLHIRPVCGLPLLHMERPELRGVRRATKEIMDRVGAAATILLLIPVLIAIALAVRCTSHGPVLFRQERVGRHGRPFWMLKFRTMVDGAEHMLPQLAAADEGNGILFKIREDPRVTQVGKVLRRYSLDELPQLFNVMRGDMSLVGPRPPLSREVERYGLGMRRRFLVKPGITGLWQISGRSDLSWDDSERLDLRYVENWSLALDLMILWKTFGAVRRASGAY